METKLTLRLNKKVIEKAKNYANIHHTSISKLVESYLESVTNQDSNTFEISPLVESLIGVIKLDKDFDYKKEYINFLKDKYK